MAGAQRGMTLVEVLVTLLIISVGLLGVGALQLTSLRNNYDAFVRSQAAVLSSEIIDRMRANRDAARGGAYNVALGPHTATSTPAETDLTAWKAALAAAMPNGDGQVAIDAATLMITVTIQWGERGEAAPLVFTTRTAL
jgi:type IV pilus assembly protein PilV